MERRRATVHGRVQGVWFRESARRRAEVLGIRGWVRNRADGAVEAVIEGEPDAVRAMLDWLRSGPPDARVDRVEVVVEDPEDLDGFAVRP